jgi:hypothetical protein
LQDESALYIKLRSDFAGVLSLAPYLAGQLALLPSSRTHQRMARLARPTAAMSPISLCISLPLRPRESNAAIRQEFDAGLFERVVDCYAGAPMQRLALL